MRSSVLGAALALAACASPAPPPPPAPALAPPPPPLVLHIAAFNDFHGNLEPPADPWSTPTGTVAAGGAAYLAAHVARLRASVPHLAVISAGDMIGATPLASALLHDEPTIEAMDAMGVDMNAVGNHELDEGVDELVRVLGGGCHPTDGCKGLDPWPGARFVTSAANLYREESDATLFPPAYVRDVAGVRVGFIGLVLSTTAQHQPPTFGGARFEPEAVAANRAAAALREDGVEALVVVVHEGLVTDDKTDMNACQNPRGDLLPILSALDRSIDLVISGHTHRAYNCLLDGRRVTSAGSYGRAYTRIALTLDRASRDVVSVEATNQVVTHDLPPEPRVAAIVARWTENARMVGDRVVGRIRADLVRKPGPDGFSTLGRFIADAQRAATPGADLAMMHARGIRTDLPLAKSGRETEDGVVTFAEVAAVHPFSNRLMTMTVTGAELLAFLQEQYFGEAERRELIPSTGVGWIVGPRAVEKVRIGGKPLDPRRNYRLTVNDYLAGRGALGKARDVRPGPTDAEALVRYFESKRR